MKATQAPKAPLQWRSIIFSTVVTLILSLLVRPAVRRVMTGGPLLNPVYFAAEDAAAALSDNGKEILLDFRADDALCFLAEENGRLAFYPFLRRFNLYYSTAAPEEKLFGLVAAGNSLYVFNTTDLPGAHSVQLVSPAGEPIAPVREAHVRENNKPVLASIFVINDYETNPGNYRKLILAADGRPLNAYNNEFENPQFLLVSGGRATDFQAKTLALTAQDIAAYPDERSNLLAAFREAVNGATETEAFKITGNDAETDNTIHLQATLGDYVKVEDKKHFYSWSHDINYTLHVSGPKQNLMTKNERHFLDRSLFDNDGLNGIKTYYRLNTGTELDTLFHYYLQKDPGWQPVGPAEPAALPEEAK